MFNRPRSSTSQQRKIPFTIETLLATILALYPVASVAKEPAQTATAPHHGAAVSRVTARIIRPTILRNGKAERDEKRVMIRRTRDCPKEAKRPATPCRLIVVDLQ